MLEQILNFIAQICALILALCFHEWAHAYAAYRCGDITPKMYGRLTLNPAAHLDLVGSLCLLLAGFGWAKPVPINPYNFRNRRVGILWTSIAGVLMNYSMAFVSYGIILLFLNFIPGGTYLYLFLFEFVFLLYSYSLVLSIFNFLPIYPLDGFQFVACLVGDESGYARFMRKYGQFILLGLLIIGAFSLSFDPLSWYIDRIGSIIGWPIRKFWELIYGLFI